MSRLRFTQEDKVATSLKIWLITGLVMIFMQVVIGGVTRLTGSGLSITKWEVVRGTIPPMNHAEWSAEFELYKETPQYHKINRGMTLEEFKFIYFWEYFHRFWARLMFFVFVIPFVWFLWRGMFTRALLPRMLIVVLLAGLEGFFGWIMVASGLIHRPWVNAYNLTLHLSLGFIIFGYLLWTTFIAFKPRTVAWADTRATRFIWALVVLAFLQIALGAMMSGTKAGLFYPTWPYMQGELVPSILLDGSHWRSDVFVNYDTNPFMPAFIQFLHRNLAYLLSILVLVFVWMYREDGPTSYQRTRWGLLAVLAVQVLLGILTLINSQSHIPVGLGVYHQACAILLFGVLLLAAYQTKCNRIKT